MHQFKNNSSSSSAKVASYNLENLESDKKEYTTKLRILSLGFIFSVLLALFLSLSFSVQAQSASADKNKYLTTFQDKTYIGLASEDDVEIIYTQCNEPISTFYFDVSNGEPMFVMAGLYDIMMYQLVAVKKENNKYVLTYNDVKGQKQTAQLEVEPNNEKIYLVFEGMKMGFVLKEKMSTYSVSNDCEDMQLASPNKKK